MAATHTSVVKRVLRTLKALPDDASKTVIELACAPLRALFTSFDTLPAAESRRRRRRITAMLAYRHLARRHGQLTNRASELL